MQKDKRDKCESQYKKKAIKALPFLVEIAQNRNKIVYGRLAGKITYGDLAELIDHFPRGMGRVCGYIRDEITKPLDLPLLNCIVVNAKIKFPTEIETGILWKGQKENFLISVKKYMSMKNGIY